MVRKGGGREGEGGWGCGGARDHQAQLCLPAQVCGVMKHRHYQVCLKDRCRLW